MWFGSAALMLLIITCSVAQLDALNRRSRKLEPNFLISNSRFEIALGRIVSRDLFASEETTSAFALSLARIRSLPFGIVFYATRARVSYSAIYSISSLIISVFLFFVGYANTR